jgi:hypothetical protein
MLSWPPAQIGLRSAALGAGGMDYATAAGRMLAGNLTALAE